MSDAFSPEERELLRHGVERGDHPVARALCALMERRVTELTEALVRAEESDQARLLQGAIRELRRWAAYPAELARQAALNEAPPDEA